MEHTVKLSEFDNVKSGNTFDILDILEKVKETAPKGAKVSWTYPGYISINLTSGTEIAFGESLEKATDILGTTLTVRAIITMPTLLRISKTLRR
jgi:hypothetical protein